MNVVARLHAGLHRPNEELNIDNRMMIKFIFIILTKNNIRMYHIGTIFYRYTSKVGHELILNEAVPMIFC